jgi:hypothetical protein
MHEYRFRLAIPAHDYLAYYQGVVREVMVTLHDGHTIQFSADILRPFVSHAGVYGEFVLQVDADNRLQSLEQVGN